MDVKTRLVALPATVLAAASVAIACGGDDDQNTGRSEVRTFPQPGAQHHVETAAQDESAADEAGESGRQGSGAGGEHEGVDATDKKQIKGLVNQFIVFAGRGDYRGVCSLYSPAGRSKLGGSSGCRSFFKGALASQRPFNGLTEPHIKFVAGGEGAIIEFEGFGRLMEMDRVNGEWFLEEVPGF